jgi:serine/threonine protein kinase
MPHSRRSRKTRRRGQRGGAYVGHGTYGCGFRPALRCEGEAERRPGKFSKLVSKDTALDEMKFRQLLSPYDRNQQYFLFPETICRPAPYAPADNIHHCPHDFSNRREARVIVLSKGGRALTRFQPLPGDYPAFFKSFQNLFDGLTLIHDDGIAHNDIKPDNIVTRRRTDGTYLTRFIDFGLMANGADLAARSADITDIMEGYNVLQSDYMYWSFDMRMTDPTILYYASMRSASTRTRLDNYYDMVTERRDFIPYKSFNHPRMTIVEVSQIAQHLGAMSLSDRHMFIMTQSDILGLGLTLAEVYYRLTGHSDRGEAAPLIKIVDGFSVPNGSVHAPIEYASIDYSAADRAWHTSVRDNISIPLYQLVRRMITANLFNRIPLASASAAFAMLLPRMATHFTRANILAHIKPDALALEVAEPVNFAAAAAALARPASSSPAMPAAAGEVAEAEDIMGFAHSPIEIVSPHELGSLNLSSSSSSSSSSSRKSGSWHEVVSRRRRRQTRRRSSSH